jgi:hypothetical protein
MIPVSSFRLPDDDQRVAVIGRTGSGKTVFGAWLLSVCNFMKTPRVIIDYKGDELLNSIERIEEIDFKTIPRHGGLYIIHPRVDEKDAMEAWLWKIWKRQRIGLYFDEAYMLPNSGYQARSGSLAAIMTQGRSRKIPVISLVQRPSQINLFVFSEADYYAVFHLNRRNDKKTVQGFAEQLSEEVISGLPQYHSRWYDVGQDKSFLMLPAPSPDEIAERIDAKLRPKRRHFR